MNHGKALISWCSVRLVTINFTQQPVVSTCGLMRAYQLKHGLMRQLVLTLSRQTTLPKQIYGNGLCVDRVEVWVTVW